MTTRKKLGYIIIGLVMGVLATIAIIIVLKEPDPFCFIADALHNVVH